MSLAPLAIASRVPKQLGRALLMMTVTKATLRLTANCIKYRYHVNFLPCYGCILRFDASNRHVDDDGC